MSKKPEMEMIRRATGMMIGLTSSIANKSIGEKQAYNQAKKWALQSIDNTIGVYLAIQYTMLSDTIAEDRKVFLSNLEGRLLDSVCASIDEKYIVDFIRAINKNSISSRAINMLLLIDTKKGGRCYLTLAEKLVTTLIRPECTPEQKEAVAKTIFMIFVQLKSITIPARDEWMELFLGKCRTNERTMEAYKTILGLIGSSFSVVSVKVSEFSDDMAEENTTTSQTGAGRIYIKVPDKCYGIIEEEFLKKEAMIAEQVRAIMQRFDENQRVFLERFSVLWDQIVLEQKVAIAEKGENFVKVSLLPLNRMGLYGFHFISEGYSFPKVGIRFCIRHNGINLYPTGHIEENGVLETENPDINRDGPLLVLLNLVIIHAYHEIVVREREAWREPGIGYGQGKRTVCEETATRHIEPRIRRLPEGHKAHWMEDARKDLVGPRLRKPKDNETIVTDWDQEFAISKGERKKPERSGDQKSNSPFVYTEDMFFRIIR